jgi:hypothetical protein
LQAAGQPLAFEPKSRLFYFVIARQVLRAIVADASEIKLQQTIITTLFSAILLSQFYSSSVS